MNLIESYKNLQEARAATILGLAKLAEYRDEGTGTHLERIREYAKMLAQEMRKIPKYVDYVTPEYIDDIFQSSILHDIGKVGIPDAILLKPGRLTPEEFEVIKRHTTFGGDAIRAIESRIKESSFLFMGKEIAYNHHEKWDGSGYPRGLKGDEIPLSARIVALADVYDALTTKRFYKEAYTHEKSKQIILDLKQIHFDPQVVDAFVKLENAFDRLREEKLREEMALIEQPARALRS
ncbi:MAG: HD domain-containing protein [Desulfobacterales bacterium]|nr:MAG: HD domain-containing protein [Desulfobacterales bacterium]